MSNTLRSDATAAPGTSSNASRWICLLALTAINYLNYIDRYIFSALLPAIKADLKFTDTELGLLGSAFLFAYVFASPLFGRWGDRGRRPRVMSGGVALWSVATAFSGVFRSFTGQFTTRALVGVGESAYTVIAPSTIADSFSKRARGKVFALYSGAIPIGSALGYVLGGWLEPRFGWQRSFYVVGVPGLMLALLLFFLPDPKRGEADAATLPTEKESSMSVYKTLAKNGGFVWTALGYAAYTFVVGGMAFWMPSYLVREYNVSLTDANIQFGAVTVLGGVVGVFVGGWLADQLERRRGNGFLKVCVLAMVIGAPLFWIALSIHEYRAFMTMLFFLEIALFLPISPVDAASLSYVRPEHRATSTALVVLIIHVLGDGISRTLMGVISDARGLHAAIEVLPGGLVVAGACWAWGIIAFWQAAPWPKRALPLEKLPRYQAHRGFRKDNGQIENTLGAFRAARAAGAEMFECDVRLSGDGQVVIFHDNDLKRLGGRDTRVDQTSAKDLGSWAQVPTLIAALNDPACPRLVNIEIKSGDASGRSGLERKVAEVVREAKAEDRVIFSSFNPLSLKRLARYAPEIPRALLVTEEDDAENKIYLKKMWLGSFSAPQMVNLHNPMITPERVERFAERGLGVAAWTVNDAARARELHAMGVKSVISDVLFHA